MNQDYSIRTFAVGVILEASLYGSTGVPPVNPFKLKNLARWGNLVIIPLSSRCFGFPLKPPA